MRTPFGDLPRGWPEDSSMSEQYDLLSARLSRRTFLRGAAAAGIAAAAPALWTQSAAATASQTVWRHVGFGADARHQASVSFATPSPFRKAVVDYGPDGSFGATVAADIRTVVGVPTLYGRAQLPALEAGRTYRYRVRLDGVVSSTGTLATAPARAEPFLFTAFGDHGVSADAQSVIGQVAKLRPRFNLVAGDLCYADTTGAGGRRDVFNPTVWDNWIRMIEPVAQTSAWMCATGNHDMEPGYGPLGYAGYLDRFVVPDNGAPGCPSTYAFQYGNVGIVSLDSNDLSYEFPHNLEYSRGGQTAWLDRQLASLRRPESAVDFIVVVFHHCVYSTNSIHGSESLIRDKWVPLFDKHQVDLVINGHAHMYERSKPLRAGRITAPAGRSKTVDSRAGTTYITAGGGGASLAGGFLRRGGMLIGPGGVRHHESAAWSLPTRSTQHSFLAIQVSPRSAGRAATMTVRALNKNGQPLDEITLTRAAVAPGSSTGSEPWAVGAGGLLAGGLATAAGATWWRRRDDGESAEGPPVMAPSPTGSGRQA